jgi:hypothetical protein
LYCDWDRHQQAALSLTEDIARLGPKAIAA